MQEHEKTQTTGPITSIWSVIQRIFGIAVTLILVAMVSLTVADVIGRYAFNRPINGAFELTEIMLATVIFLALPLTTARGEHIQVELLTTTRMPRFNQLLDLLPTVATGIILAVISWRVWIHAEKLRHDGAVTNSLSLPLSAIGYLAAISCALSACLVVLAALRKL